MEQLKTCVSCGADKPSDEFPEYNRGKHKNRCTVCANIDFRKRTGATYRSYLTLLYRQSKSSRRKAGIPFTIDIEHLCELWEQQEGKCALSNIHMTHHKDGSGRKDFNASMDRIVPELGYVHGNVQLVCDRVNTMRHTLSMDMFYWWIKSIHEQSCD